MNVKVARCTGKKRLNHHYIKTKKNENGADLPGIRVACTNSTSQMNMYFKYFYVLVYVLK